MTMIQTAMQNNNPQKKVTKMKNFMFRIKRDQWANGYPVYSSHEGWYVGAYGPWKIELVIEQATRLGDTVAIEKLNKLAKG